MTEDRIQRFIDQDVMCRAIEDGADPVEAIAEYNKDNDWFFEIPGEDDGHKL